MENDSGRRASEDIPTDEPTAAEARAVLDSPDADAAKLAGHLVTPWWYHVLLGAVVTLAISSLSIPDVSPAVVVPLVVIWLPFMLTAHTNQFSVLVSRPASRRSRRTLLLYLVVIGAIMALAVLLTTTSFSPWWGALPAVAGFGTTVALGRRFDAVLRSEVALPEAHR